MNEFEAKVVVDILELLHGEKVKSCERILNAAVKFIKEYSLHSEVFDCDYFVLKKTLQGILHGGG